MSVFDPHPCTLGEGPLWHPKRGSLIWFDIQQKTLFERKGDVVKQIAFDTYVSAAGWVDADTILLASETALSRFDLETGTQTPLVALEADNAITRSNDGRADPWGGFWIGTMGKQAQDSAGAIYRYAGGRLRQIADSITISNAICFAPDRSCAYYTDTPTQVIMRVPLDPATGWPNGAHAPFVDLTGRDMNPDGAVTDAQGNLWIAIWGSACLMCFDPQGHFVRALDLPVQQPTCPAFGGADFDALIVTSAREGLRPATDRLDGQTLRFDGIAKGQPEPQVIL